MGPYYNTVPCGVPSIEVSKYLGRLHSQQDDLGWDCKRRAITNRSQEFKRTCGMDRHRKIRKGHHADRYWSLNGRESSFSFHSGLRGCRPNHSLWSKRRGTVVGVGRGISVVKALGRGFTLRVFMPFRDPLSTWLINQRKPLQRSPAKLIEANLIH